MPFYSIALYRGNKGAWLGSPGYYLLTTPERETADLSYRTFRRLKISSFIAFTI